MMLNYYYRCWNIRCSAYAGLGYDIKSAQSITECPYCHQSHFEEVRGETPSRQPYFEKVRGETPKGLRPIVGVIMGGLFGWAAGGPAGLALGAIIGLAIGGAAEDSTRRVYKENQG